MSTNNSHPRARIVKGALVIRIPARVLAFATDNHPDYWDGENDKHTVKVVDPDQWMKSVRDALEHEEEDGSNMLTAVLDKAIAYAVDQGDEGIDFLDSPSPKDPS